MTDLRLGVLVLCFAVTFLLTALGCSIPENSNGHGVPLASFRLTKITQQRTETGYMMELCIEGSTTPRVFRVQGYGLPLEPVQMTREGIFQFNATDKYPTVMLLHPRGYQILDVCATEGNYSEQLIPNVDLVLHGVPGKNITFQRGNDVDVNITLTADTNTHFRYSLVMKSKSEDHAVTRHDPTYKDSPLTVEDEGKSGDERYAHLIIETASGEVQGLLELDVDIFWGCRQERLINDYIIHEDVPIYPADVDGPFPEDFIGLLVETSNQGEEFCSIRQRFPCSMRCEFVGDHPSKVEFNRVDQPAWEAARQEALSVSNSGFRAIGQIVLWNVTSDDEGTYQCKSSSGSVEVGKNLTLIVAHEAEINRTLSNVTIDNETVEVTCVAEGTPAPTLTFRGIPNITTFDDDNTESYQIFRTQLDDKTSQAVLRITDTAMVANMTSIECTAENEKHERHFYDFMYFRLSDADMPANVRYFLENYVVYSGSD